MAAWSTLTHILQTRRATRSTRTMKDAENAVARSTRATALRAKSTVTRATAPTAASKAKAVEESTAGKRKREALAEVSTGTNKTKPASAKGKEKEKETAVVKPPSKNATTTTTVAAVDAAVTKTTRAAKRGTLAAPPSKVPKTDKVASSKPAEVFRDAPQEEEDAEARRASKRRHMETIAEKETEVVDDSQLEVEKVAEELVKVDHESSFQPETEQLWEDLDADDWDDPLMVSEYVVDVCAYWKEVEVRVFSSFWVRP